MAGHIKVVNPPRLQDQLDTLALFPDRQERIEALIALADEYRAQPAPEVARTPANRVPGCESEVYVAASQQSDGTVAFRIAVDNPQGISAMAFARILDLGLSGEDPSRVVEVHDDIVFEVFGRELSMGKSMGLIETLRMVKAYAAGAIQQS